MSDNSGNSNPFARREEFSSQSILLYKISTGLSYIILLVTAFYYTFHKPNEGHGPHHRFWQHQPATPFAQSSIITSIYWYLQLFQVSTISTNKPVGLSSSFCSGFTHGLSGPPIPPMSLPLPISAPTTSPQTCCSLASSTFGCAATSGSPNYC